MFFNSIPKWKVSVRKQRKKGNEGYYLVNQFILPRNFKYQEKKKKGCSDKLGFLPKPLCSNDMVKSIACSFLIGKDFQLNPNLWQLAIDTMKLILITLIESPFHEGYFQMEI